MKGCSLLLALGLSAAGCASAVELTGNSQSLFDEAMGFLDDIYDPDAGYLSYFYYPLAAGRHETRSSAWYATGLLQRNEGSDLDEAVKIITNIIGGQEKNVSAQWYGDYTVYPEQPTVGTAAYQPVVSIGFPRLCGGPWWKQLTGYHRSTTPGTPTGEDSSARPS